VSAKSKSMIVTGAAQGIGAGVARTLLERGYNVVAEAPIGVMPSAHGGSENCQVVRHQRDIALQSSLEDRLKMNRRKLRHVEKIPIAKMLVALRVAGIHRGRIDLDIQSEFRRSPLRSDCRPAARRRTACGVSESTSASEYLWLPFQMLPRSRERTEKAAFLKHDRSVPPLVRGWQKACTTRGVMPSPLSPNAPDVGTQAFAVLTAAQIDCIRPLGHIRRGQSGETLYKPNDSAAPFFVVLSGQMEKLRPTLDGERLVAIHNPGCFTGERCDCGPTMLGAWTCLGTRRVSGIKQGRDAGLPITDPIPAHGTGEVRQPRMYQLVRQKGPVKRRDL
jgi:hypothetical protein